MIKRFLLLVLHGYQRTLSPDHGPFAGMTFIGCRYWPSCSEYARQAITRFGPAKGCWLGFLRLLRCHPFTRGGVDEVPAAPHHQPSYD